MTAPGYYTRMAAYILVNSGNAATPFFDHHIPVYQAVIQLLIAIGTAYLAFVDRSPTDKMVADAQRRASKMPPERKIGSNG